MLISPVIDFETFSTQIRGRGTDLAYAVGVPSFATTAWYHKKRAPDLQADLPSLVRQVAVVHPDLPAGSRPGRRAACRGPSRGCPAVVSLYRRLRGLHQAEPPAHAPNDFRRELLRDQGLEISQYDGRFTSSSGRGGQYLDQLMPPFTSAFNDYVRSELRFQSDRPYVALSDRANGTWNWGPGGLTGFLNVTDDLAAAMK